jgi:hypothetical protein
MAVGDEMTLTESISEVKRAFLWVGFRARGVTGFPNRLNFFKLCAHTMSKIP